MTSGAVYDVAKKSHASYVQVYMAARGHGSCADMMRYDSAVPADEGQAHKLDGCAEAGSKEQWVIFRRFVKTGAKLQPSVERWKSFGWEAYPAVYWEIRPLEEAIAEAENRRVREAASRLGA